ncbi:MAG: hypothetical protein U0871_07460 [Gemmataceae bacterium]
MSVEIRKGRPYLYAARRVNGRVVKVYVGPLSPAEAARQRRHADRVAATAAARRRRAAARRARIDAVHAVAVAADAALRAAAATALEQAGFHRHKRQWRRGRAMSTTSNRAGDLMAALLGRTRPGTACPEPLLNYTPADPEVAALFAKARAGDREAIDKLPDLFDAREWWGWVGHVDRQATAAAVGRLCGDDPVWKTGVVDRANKVLDGLLGDNPSMAERLLARRVQVAWLATVALELAASVRPPRDPTALAHLDRRLASATRRLVDATKALAAVRRLQTPCLVQATAVVADKLTALGGARPPTILRAADGSGADQPGSPSGRSKPTEGQAATGGHPRHPGKSRS